MKIFKKAGLLLLSLGFIMSSPSVHAATSPSLGIAAPYTILSSSYVNTASGTVLNGDLGYTTGPAVAPTVNGQTHVADAIYNQAGIDQATALADLNSQPCTFNFAPGAIDLATDVTHGPVGVYTPGVYCVTGSASIGGGGTILLSGSGTYIFRIDGALNTSANSIVTAAGASSCDVWWTPTAATTLGANSTFIGNDIDPSGITIGDTVVWNGRALAFGGTVSTTRDTINTVPGCATASATTGGNTGGLGAGSSTTTTPGLPNTGGSAPQSDNTLLVGLSAVGLTAALVLYSNRKELKSFIARS